MCKRCGKCCHRGDFWQLCKHPLIVEFTKIMRQNKMIKEDGKCLMLADGNVCLIEKYLGRRWKPQVCLDYDCTRIGDIERDDISNSRKNMSFYADLNSIGRHNEFKTAFEQIGLDPKSLPCNYGDKYLRGRILMAFDRDRKRVADIMHELAIDLILEDIENE